MPIVSGLVIPRSSRDIGTEFSVDEPTSANKIKHIIPMHQPCEAKMDYIDFFDEYLVAVKGDGQLSQSVRQYYDRLLTPKPADEVDITLREWEEEPTPEGVLGDPNSYYGREGEWFVIKDGRNFVAIDTDWSSIKASSRTSHFFVSYLLEFGLRRRLANKGYALIHASGVKIDGLVIVFPAWRHTGKTNTMLSLIRDGGGYLSDDRVWVHKSGSVRGYPLPVNMLPYNFESFPELLNVSRVDRFRADSADWIRKHVERDRSLIDKVAMFINRFYIDVDVGEVIHLDDLLPNSHFVEEAEIDSLVFLRTNHGRSNLIIEDVDEVEPLTDLMATSHYEWNARLKEYAFAHDTLFPEWDMQPMVEELIEQEADIFRQLLDNVDQYRLSLPREEEWTSEGVTSRLESVIKSM